jgi:regulator of RNase E activity RraA
MTSEYRLYSDAPPLEEAVRAGFARLASALVSDQLGRSGGLRGIRAVTDLGDRVVVGRALTVRTRPGDNLVPHQAAEFVRPGDFLVVDGGGDVDRAIIGEIWCRYVESLGAVAVALDGAARDVGRLGRSPMPVFAKGITHLGPYKDSAGELRGPVAVGGVVVHAGAVGGVVVHAGDYVIGDADGVVVVPRARALDVVNEASVAQSDEERKLADIDAGRLDRSWLESEMRLVPVAMDDEPERAVPRG